MSARNLAQKYFIINDSYEMDLLSQIVTVLKNNISQIYLETNAGIPKSEMLVKDNKELNALISDYLSGFDENSAGAILLFLANLPVVSREIMEEIQKKINNFSGLSQITAKDRADEYMKDIFLHFYDMLFENIDEKAIGVNLYYQCEKFIDSLVLEFKQNIEPLINKEDPVFDDIIYYRRLLKNYLNNNENKTIIECKNCTRDDCTYTRCEFLSVKNYHNRRYDRITRLIRNLDKYLQNGDISPEDYAMLSDDEMDKMVKKLCSVEPTGTEKDHKKIELTDNNKIFSIISAERFGKIVKRRYNGKGYEKDKDIYYMLLVGINPNELFHGDELLDKINKVKQAYVNENSK